MKNLVYTPLYMFVSFLSLTCSNVVSFSDISHQQQQTGAGVVCVFVCMCCTLSTEGSEGYGRATGPQRQLTALLSQSTPPPIPSGLLLLAWLAALQQADTPQALPPHQPLPVDIHTELAPPPPALCRSIQLYAFHLTRALEEPHFLKKTQYSLSG